jgi:hypothetical protein
MGFNEEKGGTVAAGKAAVERVKVPSCQFPDLHM